MGNITLEKPELRKELVFLFATPCLQGDVKRYLWEELLQLGYRVTVWDLTPWLDPEVERKIRQDRLSDSRLTRVVVCNDAQAENLFKEKSDQAFFLPMFYCYYEVRRVYKLLTKYHASYGYVNSLHSELDFFVTADRENLFAIHKRLRWEYVKKALYNKVIRHLCSYKPAEFIALGFDSGEQYYHNRCICDPKKTRKIYTHTYDYERFLQTKGYDNGGKKYMVFLDQFIPYHPDLTAKLGIDADPDAYFPFLNACFAALQEKYQVDIIIAAHPRADYRDRGDVFPGCKIVYGLSAELVKSAEAVIAHYSGSITFAAMAMKPLILLLPPLFQRYAFFGEHVQNYAQRLDAAVIETPETIGQLDLSCINAAAYHSFLGKNMKCSADTGESLWKTIFPNINK